MKTFALGLLLLVMTAAGWADDSRQVRGFRYDKITPTMCYLKPNQFTKKNLELTFAWLGSSDADPEKIAEKLQAKLCELIPYGNSGISGFAQPGYADPWKFFAQDSPYNAMDCLCSASQLLQALNVVGVTGKPRFIGATINNGYSTDNISKVVTINGVTKEVFIFVELQKKGYMAKIGNTIFNFDAVCEITTKAGGKACYNISFGLPEIRGKYQDLLKPKYDKDGVTILHADAIMVERYLWVDKDQVVQNITEPIPYDLWIGSAFD
ncbi:MAG: hypothetical protein PHQ23_02670 [Candidatus Wallbacteria bacterium]|nr:hypothetical protein [Candidatus Wallbacteria bacterium]